MPLEWKKRKAVAEEEGQMYRAVGRFIVKPFTFLNGLQSADVNQITRFLDSECLPVRSDLSFLWNNALDMSKLDFFSISIYICF